MLIYVFESEQAEGAEEKWNGWTGKDRGEPGEPGENIKKTRTIKKKLEPQMYNNVCLEQQAELPHGMINSNVTSVIHHSASWIK